MSASDSKYDRWQDRLRRAGKHLERAREALRTNKNLAGRTAAIREFDILLNQITDISDEVEDATDSCYVPSNMKEPTL